MEEPDLELPEIAVDSNKSLNKIDHIVDVCPNLFDIQHQTEIANIQNEDIVEINCTQARNCSVSENLINNSEVSALKIMLTYYVICLMIMFYECVIKNKK